MPHSDGPEDTPIPTLMRAARGAYGQAIRTELAGIGVEDLPRNGAFVLFGTFAADEEGSNDWRASLRSQLGVSKQAVSQLIEVLVQRGYLIRGEDPTDGRRVALDLTERGDEVTAAVARAVDSVDEELTAVVSSEGVATFRRALAALAAIKSDRVEGGVGMKEGYHTDPDGNLIRFGSPLPE